MQTSQAVFMHMTRISLVSLLQCCLLLATTTNLRGIIIKCEADQQSGTYIVTYRSTWSAGRMAYGAVQTVKVRGERIFLDGKVASPEAAFKPGHLLKALADTDYFACYSSSYRFPAVAAGKDDEHAVLTLNLNRALKYRLFRWLQKQSTWKEIERNKRNDIQLAIAIEGGSVQAVGAILYGGNRQSFNCLPVIAHRLSYANGKLHGAVELSYPSNAAGSPHKAGQASLDFHLELTATIKDGVIAGTYISRYNDQAHEGTISGQREASRRILRDQMLHLHATMTGYEGAPAISPYDLNICFIYKEGDVQAGGVVCAGYKAYPYTHINSAVVQSRGKRVQLQLSFRQQWSKDAMQLAFDGVLIGDRLFGRASFVNADGTASFSGTAFGGVLQPDAPRVAGWDEGKAKKWLRQHPGQAMPDDL